jgi:hypothetical protein
MADNSTAAVVWERGNSEWTVHVRHGDVAVTTMKLGPWAVTVAVDALHESVSSISVADCGERVTWSRAELDARVYTSPNSLELMLRDVPSLRFWSTDEIASGEIVVCDDGEETPRITGVILLGPVARATSFRILDI